METNPAKKVAAAVAAVLQYVGEVEAATLQPVRVSAGPTSPPGAPPLWGLAGRQDAMFLRSLWQRRLTKSW